MENISHCTHLARRVRPPFVEHLTRRLNRERFYPVIISIESLGGLDQLRKAQEQAACYAKSEGLDVAYLVVFTEVHPRDTLTEFFVESLDGIVLRGVW